MTSDHRITSGFITDMLDVLDRHGYARGDDQHASRAIALISDLARIWKAPRTTRSAPTSSRRPHPCLPIPAAGPTRTGSCLPMVTSSTVVVALDIAADYMRDRAELCADCADQSCPTCQSRLRDAQAYDRVAAQIDQAADARAAQRDQPEPGSRTRSPRQADLASGLEAGQ